MNEQIKVTYSDGRIERMTERESALAALVALKEANQLITIDSGSVKYNPATVEALSALGKTLYTEIIKRDRSGAALAFINGIIEAEKRVQNPQKDTQGRVIDSDFLK